jgi:hypothetical protein
MCYLLITAVFFSGQVLGLMVATAGFVIAFFLPNAGLLSEPHHILGIVVMALAYIQPLGAIVRYVSGARAALGQLIGYDVRRPMCAVPAMCQYILWFTSPPPPYPPPQAQAAQVCV